MYDRVPEEQPVQLIDGGERPNRVPRLLVQHGRLGRIEQELVLIIEEKIEKRVHHEKVQVYKHVRVEVEIHEPGFREGIVVDRDTQIETTTRIALLRR